MHLPFTGVGALGIGDVAVGSVVGPSFLPTPRPLFIGFSLLLVFPHSLAQL
jgi:hypothetical protein